MDEQFTQSGSAHEMYIMCAKFRVESGVTVSTHSPLAHTRSARKQQTGGSALSEYAQSEFPVNSKSCENVDLSSVNLPA